MYRLNLSSTRFLSSQPTLLPIANLIGSSMQSVLTDVFTKGKTIVSAHFRLMSDLFLTSLILVAVLFSVAVTPHTAHATDSPLLNDRSSSLPYTIVRPPRVDPPPISHTDIIEPTYLYNRNVGAGHLPAQSAIASEQADHQGIVGEPGVLQTKTDIGEGLTLHSEGNICNDFNSDDYWNGTTWTDYFAGWGPFAADDGFHQAKNVTFDREENVGPGEKHGENILSTTMIPKGATMITPLWASSLPSANRLPIRKAMCGANGQPCP